MTSAPQSFVLALTNLPSPTVLIKKSSKMNGFVVITRLKYIVFFFFPFTKKKIEMINMLGLILKHALVSILTPP